MHDATSLPNDLDACHQLIDQLSSRLQSQQDDLHSKQGQLQDQLQEQTRDRQSRETFVEEQSRTVVALESSREKLSLENVELKLTVQKLLARLYGRRSERLVDGEGQLKLDFGDNAQAMAEALEEAVLEAERRIAEIEANRKSRRRRTKRQRNEQLPPHLPREERIIEVPEDLQNCPTHGERKVIRYDETETLVFDRPQLRVVVTKYPVLSCPGKPKCGISSPERPTGLIEGNRFDVSVAVEVIAAKYFYHLPFYRQQDMFAGSGWTPSRSTLLNILTAAEFALQPLASYYRDLISEIDSLGCDETTLTLIVPPTLPTLDPLNPRSKRILEVLSKAQADNRRSVNARMWAYRSVVLPFNVFDFTVSRHRDGPDEILSSFTGKLMGDCWSGFQKIELRSNERIVRAACWAHARRKLHECRINHPQHTTVLLSLVRQLYDLEDRAKLWTEEDRLRLRQGESTQVLEKIRQYLDSESLVRVLPKSDLGKALGYLRRHWDALQVYAGDGRLPIDNNETEQLMRQVALGRNYVNMRIMRTATCGTLNWARDCRVFWMLGPQITSHNHAFLPLQIGKEGFDVRGSISSATCATTNSPEPSWVSSGEVCRVSSCTRLQAEHHTSVRFRNRTFRRLVGPTKDQPQGRQAVYTGTSACVPVQVAGVADEQERPRSVKPIA